MSLGPISEHATLNFAIESHGVIVSFSRIEKLVVADIWVA